MFDPETDDDDARGKIACNSLSNKISLTPYLLFEGRYCGFVKYILTRTNRF